MWADTIDVEKSKTPRVKRKWLFFNISNRSHEYYPYPNKNWGSDFVNSFTDYFFLFDFLPPEDHQQVLRDLLLSGSRKTPAR